jgi:hypothetical protein
LIDRKQIFDEAKKHGLVRSGYYFIDYQHDLLINSAYLISRIRKLSESMSLGEAIDKLIDEEHRKFTKTKA